MQHRKMEKVIVSKTTRGFLIGGKTSCFTLYYTSMLRRKRVSKHTPVPPFVVNKFGVPHPFYSKDLQRTKQTVHNWHISLLNHENTSIFQIIIISYVDMNDKTMGLISGHSKMFKLADGKVISLGSD